MHRTGEYIVIEKCVYKCIWKCVIDTIQYTTCNTSFFFFLSAVNEITISLVHHPYECTLVHSLCCLSYVTMELYGDLMDGYGSEIKLSGSVYVAPINTVWQYR